MSHRNHSFREEWQPASDRATVNFWEAPVRIIALPPKLKLGWHEGLASLVSGWAGGVELEPTQLYGIRIYSRGSRLIPHVDREDTHALSLILNVDQGGIDEEWALEVDDMLGREDSEHAQTLSPGQLLLYESARCLHSRKKPLRGEYYANLFAHYRPKGRPRWWESPKAPPVITRAGGRRLEFNVQNGGASQLHLFWQTEAGGYEPVQTLEPGESTQVRSFVGHHFKIRGTCSDAITVHRELGDVVACDSSAPPLSESVPAQRMDPPPETTRLFLENQVDKVAEVFWIEPATKKPLKIETIPGYGSRTINTRLGHVLQVRGACAQALLVSEPDATELICAHAITEEDHKRRLLVQIADMAQALPVKFKNLCNRTVGVWQDRSGDRESMHQLKPGATYAINTRPGLRFCVALDEGGGGGAGCERPLAVFTITQGRYLYAYDPREKDEATELPEPEEPVGAADASVLAAWLEERRQAAAYFETTGRHWMAHPGRVSPQLPMRAAERVGDELEVRTSETPSRSLQLTVVSTAPRVFVVKNFLSAEEASKLIELGRDRIERSSQRGRVSSSRTSSNAWLSRGSAPVTEAPRRGRGSGGGGQGHTRTPFVPQVLFRRAADVLGIDEARISDDSSSSGLCEPIQLVHYAPGQKYDASTAERAR